METFNQFLTEANSATQRHEYTTPMSYLMTSTIVSPSIETGTPGPVNEDTLRDIPFTGWTVDSIIDWAQRNLLHTDLSPRSMVVLDQRSTEDATCLLITEVHSAESSDVTWRRQRSDFASSVVSLMTLEMGCGGDEMLDPDEGSDGVLRTKDQCEWSATSHVIR